MANIPAETKPGDQLTTAFPVLLCGAGWNNPHFFFPAPALLSGGSAEQGMWLGTAEAQGNPSTWNPRSGS